MAMTHREKLSAERQEMIHDFLKGFPIDDTLNGVAAFIEAQPNLSEHDQKNLKEFSKLLSRISWKYE